MLIQTRRIASVLIAAVALSSIGGRASAQSPDPNGLQDTWAKSTDSKSAAADIGASGYNGWQGWLNNHDPERDYGRLARWGKILAG